MKKYLLTFFWVFTLGVSFAQNKPIYESKLFHQVYDWDNDYLICSREVSLFSSDSDVKWSIDVPGWTVHNSGFFLSNKKKNIYFMKGLGYADEYKIQLVGINFETQNTVTKTFREKGYSILEFFPDNSNFNVLIKSTNQKEKNGEPFKVKWLRFDNELNKTTKTIEFPSYVGKGYKYFRRRFVGEQDGSIYYVNKYFSTKLSEPKLELMKIDSFGKVTLIDLSTKLPIGEKAIKIDYNGEKSIVFEYVAKLKQIAFQYLNEDGLGLTVGMITLDGDIVWESKLKLPKEYPVTTRRVTATITKGELSVINDEIILAQITSMGAESTFFALLNINTGAIIKEYSLVQKDYTQIPSSAYLGCMYNPKGDAKSVVKEIQDSVKKTKHLRKYTMGYMSNSNYELIWINEDYQTKLYRFEF